ncbi:MAG: aminotransferase class I/II-fold pyridoxal phosphate-dependent enzyme, partial [Pseudodesulfovibrio sp.]
FMPLLEENDFLPDLDSVDDATWTRAKMIFVCYPNNPTSATAPREFYERLIKKARQFKVIVVSDLAYSEIYYDPAKKPMSILECEGAKDVCIEFHSLSKTYNMTGWRIGMAVGNASLVAGLGKIKENVDSGIFQAVQEAGIAALSKGEPHAERFRAIYKERRDVMSAALNKAGIKHRLPDASFYLWCNTPKGYTSSEFVTKVLKETGVVLTPGQGFGTPGEGYFRISLTVSNNLLEEAVSKISKL